MAAVQMKLFTLDLLLGQRVRSTWDGKYAGKLDLAKFLAYPNVASECK